MSTLENSVIPQGSIVLVTGVSGFVGSHVADQFLQHGYKVRGTARDLNKCAWLSTLFDKKYGKGVFEIVLVTSMDAEGAFDQAVRGVSAIAHTASVMGFDPNPNAVIPVAVAGAVNAIKAAYAEPSVKRFVYTSSSSAVYLSDPSSAGKIITKDSWNEDAKKAASADLPNETARGVIVYAASKVLSEQAIWKFYKENQHKRPDLTVNTVLPNLNFGRSLDPDSQGHPTSSQLPVYLWNGEVRPIFQHMAPQYYTDVQDNGRLHVAAAVHPDVKGERILAFAGRFNWNDILAIMRRNFPARKFPGNFDGRRDPNEIEGGVRAEQLLREMGRPGWTSLEDSILMNLEDLSRSSS